MECNRKPTGGLAFEAVRRSIIDGHLVTFIEDRDAEQAAGPALALHAVTHGNLSRFTRASQVELPAMAAGGAGDHASDPLIVKLTINFYAFGRGGQLGRARFNRDRLWPNPHRGLRQARPPR
jgi:hypothetical protein